MKKLLTLLMSLILVMSFVQAEQPPMPAPVKILVKVNEQAIDYEDTKVTNKRTGEVLTKDDVPSLRIDNGIGAFDLSKFKLGYQGANPIFSYPGDEIEIVACNVHADCTTSFFVDITPIDISIFVQSGTVFVCWDNSVVSDPNNCPEQPQPEPEPVVEVESKLSSNDDKSVASIEADYGQEIEVIANNNKLSQLLDDKIEFDSELYDVKEQVELNAFIFTSLDDVDFEDQPYLTIAEGDIFYKYIFDDKVTLEDVSEEDPLEITFLGEPIKIIEASENKITVRSGVEKFLKEGEKVTIEGKSVLVKTIGEDSVLVSVDGTEEIINDGNSKKVNNLNVIVEEILYKDYEDGYVELILGSQSDEVINDGDDFELFEEDADEYKWVVSLPDYIGITNQEEFMSIDEEDDLKAITVDQSILLPNNFMEIKFKEIIDSERVDLEFKVKDNYLFVKGNADDSFVFDSDEYTKLYIDANGIYDDDKEFITDDKVRIGNSDTYLELGSVKIANLEIKLDMSDILYDGVSFKGKEDTFLDYFGLIFSDPENAVEDQEGFVVSVPEERPEAIITLTLNVEVEEEEPVIVEPVEPEPEPVEPIEPPAPVPVPEPKPEPITPPEPKPEPEDDNELLTYILYLIAGVIAIFSWGKGFAGLIKYYVKKGKEAQKAGDTELAKKYFARAEKMAKTVLTNFMAGKYKK